MTFWQVFPGIYAFLLLCAGLSYTAVQRLVNHHD
jgi:hypothetical protein